MRSKQKRSYFKNEFKIQVNNYINNKLIIDDI